LLFDKPASIRNSRVFKNADGNCFLISKQGNRYYLEDAETAEEAKAGIFEDMDSYSGEENTVIRQMKSDILNHIVFNSPLADRQNVLLALAE
jgi:hypothetical protein